MEHLIRLHNEDLIVGEESISVFPQLLQLEIVLF